MVGRKGDQWPGGPHDVGKSLSSGVTGVKAA